ncbi:MULTISPECIES: hypothetical protein [Cohnella]|jgi:peptidoglycan hydrolase CwlO-like protein|uniref:hypothetical protein n=1 Tax=Cohnella TaxID=329857 RepID=UPI000E36EE60|nr:hypothetical protein [Cohnella sp.]REK68042.1 MAG: hypothetical protein C6P35_03480 [Cohnella sp.]
MNSEVPMNVPTDTMIRKPRRTSKPSVVSFLMLWAVLVGAGMAGSVWYAGKLKHQIAQDVERQTAAQIEALKSDYIKRIEELKTGYTEEMGKLESKIDSLNELLTFTQDNANSKTDNSNKLYTQISELKKQLDQLKKELDVLK